MDFDLSFWKIKLFLFDLHYSVLFVLRTITVHALYSDNNWGGGGGGESSQS